jgi:hypothetical protein
MHFLCLFRGGGVKIYFRWRVISGLLVSGYMASRFSCGETAENVARISENQHFPRVPMKIVSILTVIPMSKR